MQISSNENFMVGRKGYSPSRHLCPPSWCTGTLPLPSTCDGSWVSTVINAPTPYCQRHIKTQDSWVNSRLLRLHDINVPRINNFNKANITWSVTSVRSLEQWYDGSRTKLLPSTNFYVEILTQFRIKLLHVVVLTNFRIKLLRAKF